MTRCRDRTLTATRRTFLHTVAGSAASLALASSGGLGRAVETSPIKIGFLNSFSRAFATLGETAFNGINLYFDQIGWQSAGRKIEIIKEDDQISPQVGLEKTRKLVESDRVQILCGPTYTPLGLAMLPYLEESKTPWFVTGAGSVAASATRMPYMFRTCWSTWQVAAPIGKWVFDNVAKEIVLLTTDINSGHDVLTSFKSTFVALGGKVLNEISVPLGANDYSPYLTQIRSIKPPATYSFFGGTDAVRFVKQYAEYGLKGRVLMIGFQSLLDSDTIAAQGDAAIGGVTSSIYAASLDTKENKAFVAAYRKKYSASPTIFAETAYTTARIIDDALRATAGEIENKDEFAAAVRTTQIVAPSGPFRFDLENQLAIRNIYILRAEKVDGQVQNIVVDTVKDVRDPDSKGT